MRAFHPVARMSAGTSAICAAHRAKATSSSTAKTGKAGKAKGVAPPDVMKDAPSKRKQAHADTAAALRPAAAAATSPSAAPAEAGTGAVVRNFRADVVLAKVKPNDVVLAKQEGPSLYSYLAFPGLDTKEVAARLLQIPSRDRHVHTLFGREHAKCDLVLDLDFGLCQEAKGHADFFTGESVLLETLHAVRDHYSKVLKLSAPTDIVVLDGNSQKKHSYHVHVRSSEGVYVDFAAARDVASEVNASLTRGVIDIGVFRPKGTMRVAFSPKFTEPSRQLLPLKAKDPELQRLLKPMLEMPDVAVMERSLVVNPHADSSMKPIKAKNGKGATAFDEYGVPISPFLYENKKWVRYGEAVAAVKRLPVYAAEDYNTWVRVGLALHSFGNDRHILDVWKNFSARCRHKYNPQLNDRLWEMFSKRPNCFNWRRGYYYMTRSITKQLRSQE